MTGTFCCYFYPRDIQGMASRTPSPNCRTISSWGVFITRSQDIFTLSHVLRWEGGIQTYLHKPQISQSLHYKISRHTFTPSHSLHTSNTVHYIFWRYYSHSHVYTLVFTNFTSHTFTKSSLQDLRIFTPRSSHTSSHTTCKWQEGPHAWYWQAVSFSCLFFRFHCY